MHSLHSFIHPFLKSSAMASFVSAPQQRKQRIVAIPFPVHGHIAPLLHLCTRLAASGFSISFVNTDRNHLEAARSFSHYPPTLDLQFLSLPDNLPPDFRFTGFDTFCQFLQAVEDLRWAFENLMELQLTSPTRPLCILSDVHVGWTQDVATKFQLPRIALWTSNASECQIYFQVPRLISQGYLPFKETSKSATISIPGLPPLQPREFPSFLQIQDAANICFSFFIHQTMRIAEADMVLINSFLELENSVFDALRLELRKVYPVGPLFLLDDAGANTPSCLSAEEDRCLKWLDNQAAHSVLYVSFGSTAALTSARIESLASGLERSQQPFLWALRSATVGQVSDHLPDGFTDRTRDRGLIVSWAPQVRVLEHPSVGGFLTHCGWNSVLESLCMGVPMMCSPIGADQTLTCKMIVDEWKVGLGFSESDAGFAKEGELATLATEMLVGEKGRSLRSRVRHLRDATRRAIEEGGESWRGLHTLVEQLKRWCDAGYTNETCNC